ncbi:MAG TPA: hypothetical protein VKS79_00200 [Gemmataceae bacterium]|nr:hypothetical protein [Gemmataceae bacterium]
MLRFSSAALVAVATLCTMSFRTWADPPPMPAAEQRDPEKVFAKACDWLKELESKQPLLKGVSDLKPVVEHDENNRLK